MSDLASIVGSVAPDGSVLLGIETNGLFGNDKITTLSMQVNGFTVEVAQYGNDKTKLGVHIGEIMQIVAKENVGNFIKKVVGYEE